VLPAKDERSSYNLEVAYALACERLASIDIEQQCRHSGSEYQRRGSQQVITVRYLNQPYLITLPEVEISLGGSAEPVPMRDKILILHYLTQAKGTPVTGRLITFRDLPGGNIYYPTFAKRTIRPLTDHFGQEPALLLANGEKLGGHRADYGDTAITINAFSRVPITLVLWHGDDELPPQLNLLLDSSIPDYLETEDVTVLCETLTWRLIRSSRAG